MTVDFCALPTAEQPLRLAEWDELFADAVISAKIIDPLRAQLTLRAQHGLAARAADLALRETECCSFFTFTLKAAGGQLLLEVTVPSARREVLEALVGRISRIPEDDHA